MPRGRDAEFTPKEWARILSRKKWKPSHERVVSADTSLNTVKVRKQQWQTHFRGWCGLSLRKGREIEVVLAESGSPKVELPDWACRQLSLAAGDGLCITEREGRFFLKKLRLVERPTVVPGCTIIDEFGETEVIRAYTLLGDFGADSQVDFEKMLSAVGKFRHDPLTPLRDVDGRIGLLARKELLGGWTKTDRAKAAEYRRELTASQLDNGSWQDSVTRTGFAVIRLLEASARPNSDAVTRACRWLLSLPEPDGFPGLFLSTPELTNTFNEWREEMGGVWKQFRLPRNEGRDAIVENCEMLGVGLPSDHGCHAWSLWASSVALEALLRCGHAAEERVSRGINTLLAMRLSGNTYWCANGMRRSDLTYPESSAAPDFNSLAPDLKADRIDWPTTRREVMGKAAGARYCQWDLGQGRAALLRGPGDKTYDCSSIVQRALSWHPEYRGSAVEMTGSLECEGWQGWDGSWPSNHVSAMLVQLERFSTNVAALAVLRSIPLLIRQQGRDGLWDESAFPPLTYPGTEPRQPWSILPKETSTFIILKALAKFDFLESLLPTGRD